MSLAGIQHLALGGTRLQIQHGIQRIELEIVPVRFPRRRAGASVADTLDVSIITQTFDIIMFLVLHVVLYYRYNIRC